LHFFITFSSKIQTILFIFTKTIFFTKTDLRIVQAKKQTPFVGES